MWEKGKVNASPTTHLRPTIMKYNLVSKQIDAQYLPYACHGHLMGISWTSHRLLIDLSWTSHGSLYANPVFKAMNSP